MKTDKYIIALAALSMFAACRPDEPPCAYKLAVNSINLDLNAMNTGRTRAIVAGDPTTSDPGDRAGQLLDVAIGAESADYVYDSGSDKWIPAESDAPLSFPGLNRADVSFTLSTGADDPVGGQDSTQDKLLAADVLTGSLTGVIPSSELNVRLEHANTLLDIMLSGTDFDPSKVTAVAAGSAKACNIPYGSSPSTPNWQVIIAPGSGSADLEVTYDGLGYACTIAPVLPATAFDANTRYLVSLELKGGVLVCGSVWVTTWKEGSGGSGQSIP